MNVHLNINSSAIVRHVNRLEKMKKSALPTAVRGTLNKAALNVKTKTMPVSAAKHMVQRNKTFFKANSRAELARGYEVKSMKSIVGFTPNKIRANPFAVQELEEQEFGGRIRSRSYIPFDFARSGDNPKQMVLPSLRLRKIRKIVDSNKGRGSRKTRFVRASFKAGRGGFVLGNFGKRNTLFRVMGIKKEKGRVIITRRPIYSHVKGRSVSVKARGFMKEAVTNSARNMNNFFIEEANRVYSRIK